MKEENNLYGLVYNCPILQRKGDCPFMKVDQLSFKEKVKWLEGLSKEEKEAILEHHQGRL
jgi:hypothetical protein